MNRNSRIFPVEVVEHRRQYADNEWLVRADPDFTDRRIGNELDVFHCLAQVIEHGRSAIKQGTAILRRLDAMPAAVEQWGADRLFEVRD